MVFSLFSFSAELLKVSIYNMYKAIIFDLGRVLVKVDITRGFFGLFDVSRQGGLDAAVQQIMNHKIFKQFNRGQLTPEEFHKEITSEFNIEISYRDFAAKWCDVFSPMPGMYELVETLSKKYTLGLLSDTDPLHWNYVAANYPILKFFPNPTLSFNIKTSKPQPEAFELAAKSVNTAPANCIYIDDLPENVAGAAKTGIKAIKFQSAEQIKCELGKLGISVD
jgi:glucose-1-phosphatase